MEKIKAILRNKWFGFIFWSLLYILWFVVWTGNLWLLLGLVVIYDIYISKTMYRLFWRKHKERNDALLELLPLSRENIFAADSAHQQHPAKPRCHRPNKR